MRKKEKQSFVLGINKKEDFLNLPKTKKHTRQNLFELLRKNDATYSGNTGATAWGGNAHHEEEKVNYARADAAFFFRLGLFCILCWRMRRHLFAPLSISLEKLGTGCRKKSKVSFIPRAALNRAHFTGYVLRILRVDCTYSTTVAPYRKTTQFLRRGPRVLAIPE